MARTRHGKSKLTEEQKAFVVQRLACWDTPAEASEALREEHGVELSPQGCEAYDPTKRAGRRVARKWRELFNATREAFKKNLGDHVPEANKAVRVRHLAHAARAFKQRNNYLGMADMFERIAKELGNVHTNRREISGRDGKPVEVEYRDMTDEQLDARLLQLLKTVGGADAGDGQEARG